MSGKLFKCSYIHSYTHLITSSALQVARYSFSGSIPSKSEHKKRRRKQRFEKIASTVVSDFLWSGLQWHRSCHSNEMTLLPILLAAVFRVIEIFWDKVFMVRNTVKKGQSWCSAIMCRKRSAFDMQFHLIVVSIFLKRCVKDHGDSPSRLLERRIWLVCIEALLLAVCKHFFYFNKLANNF